MIRLLIVDDSALMRRYLKEMFAAEGDFEIATAGNGEDALKKIKELKPDVVTLDINMPVMDGITCLSRIMVECPCPVVMVSSMTTKNAEITFEALALGAVDYAAKPGGTISLNIKSITDEIIRKVRAAVGTRVKTAGRLVERLRSQRIDSGRRHVAASVHPGGEINGLVIIGVSTGGPQTLEEILPDLPADFPFPVIIAQHMPANFTKSFAARLNSVCQLEVLEVTRPIVLERGKAYLGKGDADILIRKRGDKVMTLAAPAAPEKFYHPNVDVLVESALAAFPPRKIIGALLTGMGADGANAMAELRRRGGRTIAESEESCIVFGMPRELIELNGAEFILPSNIIGKKIVSLTKFMQNAN